MAKLKRVNSKKLLKKLKKVGFCEIHQRGSHLAFKNNTNSRFVIAPMHNSDIPIGTL